MIRNFSFFFNLVLILLSIIIDCSYKRSNFIRIVKFLEFLRSMVYSKLLPNGVRTRFDEKFPSNFSFFLLISRDRSVQLKNWTSFGLLVVRVPNV